MSDFLGSFRRSGLSWPQWLRTLTFDELRDERNAVLDHLRREDLFGPYQAQLLEVDRAFDERLKRRTNS